MEIVIHTDESQPQAAQLVGQLKRAVMNDELGPDNCLPSVRQLANDLDISAKTVAQAYRQLESESLIRPGRSGSPIVDVRGRTALRLAYEMSVARSIHDRLVSPLQIETNSIEATGVSVPSAELGGDLIDAVSSDRGTDLFLADACGHGVGAGIVMAMLKSAIRMGTQEGRALPELLEDLNNVMYETLTAGLFATLACLRIDPRGRLEYALVGHHHLLHYRTATGSSRRLSHRNYPLGLFESRSFTTDRLCPEPGDLCLVYTDGLSETTDASGEEFGHDRIERTLEKHASRSLGEIQHALFDAVVRFGRQRDDRTLLLVRFKSENG
jgi:serine phosphatase RsbU (regulator of sigma subunit)